MRIAMMTNNYKPFVAGVPISIERLANGLRKEGHEVVIFAPTYKEQKEEADTFRYHSLLQGIYGGVAIPSPIDLRIEKEFKKREFDVIHVHHPMVIGKTAAYLSKKYKIPLVFTYHTRYEQYVHYVMPKRLLSYPKIVSTTENLIAGYLKGFFKHCDHIFVPTAGLAEYLTKECNCEASKLSVLPTGLAENSFAVEKDASENIRKQYGAGNCPVFISVSRLAKEKNICFLLDSLARYKEKYGQSFKMLMVGEGPDKEQLIQYAKESGLSENVIFTGKIDNVRLKDYYGASDAFLFASKSETQGIVLLEAFAAGTPVIGVHASGVSDLVIDGKNGFLVPEDTDVFADRMQILITDSLLAERLKEGARATSLLFDESNIAKEAIKQYNRVMDAAKAGQFRMTGLQKQYIFLSNNRRGADKWKTKIVS